MTSPSPFSKVDQLMEKLAKDYPGLNKTVNITYSRRPTPTNRNTDTPVRSTIPADFALTILKENSKFSKITEIKLPKPPKNPRPITVKVNE